MYLFVLTYHTHNLYCADMNCGNEVCIYREIHAHCTENNEIVKIRTGQPHYSVNEEKETNERCCFNATMRNYILSV